MSLRAIDDVRCWMISSRRTWWKPRFFDTKSSISAFLALSNDLATARLSDCSNNKASNSFDNPKRSLHNSIPTAVRIDRLVVCRKVEYDKQYIRSSNWIFDKLVKALNSWSDKERVSSKFNRRRPWKKVCQLLMRSWTSVTLNSFNWTDAGAIRSTAFAVNWRSTACSEQNRAPSGIQTFFFRKT